MGAGLFVSRDGGESWLVASDIEPTFVAGLLTVGDDGQRLFARTRRGLFRTLDGGVTWQRVAASIKPRVDALAYDAIGERVLLATNDGRVYRGRAEQDDWRPWDAGVGRSGTAFALAPAPEPPGGWWLATQSGLYLREQGGSWQHAGVGLGISVPTSLAQAADGTLYVSAIGGVYASTDSGVRWQRRSNGLPAISVLSVAVAASDPRVVYAGTDGMGLFRSDDGGHTWIAPPALETSPTAASFPSESPPRPVPVVAAVAVSPVDPMHVYARAAFERLYESRDGGASWSTHWQGLDLQTEVITVAVDPANPDRIFAGGTQRLFRSDNGGESWQAVGPELDGQTVYAVAFDINKPDFVYAGATKGAYRSENSGEHWSPWGDGLEDVTVTALVLAPHGRDIYAGSKYKAVFSSTDMGATWQPIGPQRDTSVNGLTLSSSGDRLTIAATTGLWRGILQ